MRVLHIDFETRSCADLKKFGAARYAQDPSTEVICLALKWQGQEPVLWYSPNFRSGVQSVSDETVKRMVTEAEAISGHNVSFEFFIWKYVMPRYGFSMFDAGKLRCSLAKAAMYGLPRSLEQACEAIGVAQQKDKEGSRLMLRLCKPRRALKADMMNDPDWETRTYWYGSPEEFARLGAYCMQDVRAEEALSSRLPDLPETEQRVWQLDLAINDRGVRVDAEAAQAVLDCIGAHSEKLTKEFARMTGLASPSQRDATLRCLLALGVQMEGLRAKDVEEALATTENKMAKRILEIRQSLSKTSTAKYTTLLGAKMLDDRLRGMFMYHGAGTGRWTGRIVQLQNLPRGSFSDVDWAIDLFRNHDLEMLSMFYGDIPPAAATCLRGMLIPADGKEFICADYSSIEGRVLAWLAGEESALGVYRAGHDPYKVAASAIYHVAYDDVTKAQRQRGKVAELACIAEGELVLTDKGLVPIELVTTGHRVWDGFEWVEHEGVIYKGEKEIMEYEGLRATPDHLVWVGGEHRPIRFGDAASCRAHLVQTGDGGTALRLGDDYIPGKEMERGMGAGLRPGPMPRMRKNQVDESECSYEGKVQRMPEVLAAEADSPLAGKKAFECETPVRESGRSRFSELWRERRNVRLSIRSGSGSMAYEAFPFESGAGDRQDRQQQGLRSGEHPACDTSGKLCKPQDHGTRELESGRVAVCPQRCRAEAATGENEGCGSLGREESRTGEAQELESHRAKARVYDLLNAGPRHRFTVSGVLVHNCGYQGSVNAFNAMAVNYGVALPEDEVREIVAKWRDSRPVTVQFWRNLERACTRAVEKPGSVWDCGKIRFKVSDGFLKMRLPSGRILWYASPRIAMKEMSWGEQKAVVAFDGVDSKTRKWGRQYLYGGLLAENATQATARDLLVNGMFAVESAGYPIVLHVHDELVAEVPEGFGSVEEFGRLMCTLPEWGKAIPVKAEGWRGKRYKK